MTPLSSLVFDSYLSSRPLLTWPLSRPTSWISPFPSERLCPPLSWPKTLSPLYEGLSGTFSTKQTAKVGVRQRAGKQYVLTFLEAFQRLGRVHFLALVVFHGVMAAITMRPLLPSAQRSPDAVNSSQALEKLKVTSLLLHWSVWMHLSHWDDDQLLGEGLPLRWSMLGTLHIRGIFGRCCLDSCTPPPTFDLLL